MAIKISERFSSVCTTVTNNSYDTCGTITRSDINYLTPAELETMFTKDGLFADLDAWFHTAIEMKACGTRTYGLYDWIMSGADRERTRLSLNTQKIMRGPSLLQPFVMARQDSVINVDFWSITQGQANSAYTAEVTGPLTAADKLLGAAGDRVIRVVSRYGVDLDEKWFVDRDTVQIFSRSAGGEAEQGQWKVLASAVASDNSYVDVLLTSENAGSAGLYDLTPTAGVLLPGVNNVNDFESWCHNRPNYDGRKMIPFWFQTMRRSRCTDQFYREWYARLTSSNVNRAFREFGDLDEAKRNAQDELNWQKRWVNSFFYNKPIGVNQTLANWKLLDDIVTPTGYTLEPVTGNKVVAKRANFIGAIEQLRRCDRLRDLSNQPLNLVEFFNEIYQIVRARKTNGRNVTDIDVYTNSVMKAQFFQAMLSYYKSMYQDMVSLNVDMVQQNQKNSLGMVWDSYYVLHPGGVRINIISHEHFDDWRDINRQEGQESIGNSMLILDLGKPGGANGGTIYWAQIASNRVRHVKGELDNLAKLDASWACVMETNTQELVLTSETGLVVVECPAYSLVIHNIGLGTPVHTGAAGVSLTDLY